MSKVMLVVTFRTNKQYSCDLNEDRLPIVKQRIDIANAGKLEQEAGHSECFTFSLPCEIDLSQATGPVGLNLVNDQVAILIRHISNAIPDAVIIASAGCLMESEDPVKTDDPVMVLFHTALFLLREIDAILAVYSLEKVAAPALTDCMRRINAFLDEHDKDRSAMEPNAGVDAYHGA